MSLKSTRDTTETVTAAGVRIKGQLTNQEADLGSVMDPTTKQMAYTVRTPDGSKVVQTRSGRTYKLTRMK